MNADEVFNWARTVIEVAAMAAVFIRVGSFTGKVQTQIEGLSSNHEKLVRSMSQEHAKIGDELRDEIEKIERSHASLRAEQRANNIRLYERWERTIERVGQLDGATRANADRVLAIEARLRNGS